MSLCKEFKLPHSAWLEWEPEDRAKAMAFLIEEGTRCQMCGTAPWEWEEDNYAYEPIGHLCRGCYLKDTAQEDSKNLPGTTVVLEPSSAISVDMREERLRWERKLAQEERENAQRKR